MSNTTTIRVSYDLRDRLASLAKDAGEPMTVTLDHALAELERRRFFEQVNRRYQELRDDPEAWRVILEERAEWDATLADGLD